MTDRAVNSPASPWPHRWAVVLCCATFPLIWVGALVTTYSAGMAVPDWPSTYGYNLFLYPWETWLFGPFNLLVEHGHRLLGALAGMLTIGLVISTWVCGASRGVRVLALLALVGVIAQGLLGGARVLLDARTLAMIHGCTGPAFFALTAAIAVVTSRRWREGAKDTAPLPGAMALSTIVTAALAYLQLVFGAMLRHVPVDADPQWFRIVVLFHIVTALILAGHVFFFSSALLRQQRDVWLTRPTSLLVMLVGLQLLLGIGTWVSKYAWPAALGDFQFAAGYVVTANSLTRSLIVTAHVAVGSLILATAVTLAVRSGRWLKESSWKFPFDARVRGLAV